MGPDEIAAAARDRFAPARMIWKHHEYADGIAARIRKALTPIVDDAVARGAEVRLIGVVPLSVAETKSGPEGSFNVMLEVLDQSGARATWTTYTQTMSIDFVEDAAKAVANQMKVQVARARRKRANDEAGIAGSIDTMTLAALRSTGRNVEEILRTLKGTRQVKVELGRKGRLKDTLRMTWKEGVVHSSFDITERARWIQGQIILGETVLPEAVIQSMPGRPLTDLVAHEWIDPAATIRSLGNRGRWTFIRVKVATASFSAETGEIVRAA
jgi:hypothetical protein